MRTSDSKALSHFLSLIPAIAAATVAMAPAFVLAAPSAPRATTLNPRPITFEPNVGQADPAVRYLARGGHGTLLLTGDEVVLLVPGAGGASEPLRARLAGAQDALCVEARDQRPGRVNYYRGSDPSKWRTGAPTFGSVAYEGVYPGIDLVYHGSDGQLEYDFVVEPGADPAAVRLRFDGAREMTLEPTGELRLRLDTATVVQHAPVVYQMVDGARRPVPGRFVLEGENQVGFAVGDYDRGRELVIDPVLGYSTYIGGSGSTEGGGGCCQDGMVDGAGNYYLLAGTNSIDYPVTADAFDPSPSGAIDLVVTALGADGGSLLYSTYIGGARNERGEGLVVGSDGSIYVAAETGSTDMPTTSEGFDQTANGGLDGYVAVLTPSGGALVYATYVGGSAGDTPIDLAVDSDGQVVVTGYTASSDFPTTANAWDRTHGGARDAFVTKFNAAGSGLVFSTYLGGRSDELDPHVAVDANADVFVTGTTYSSDFPVTRGAYDRSFGGKRDAFVTKMASDGASLVYSTYLGSQSDVDRGQGIAVDSSGNAFVLGLTNKGFPTTDGAYDRTHNGEWDWFVTKLNPTGSDLVYSTYLGGRTSEAEATMALATDGRVWVTGGSWSTDFPTTPDAIDPTANGNTDAIVTGLTSGGDSLIYSSYLGGTLAESSFGISILGNSVYLTGSTFSSDFPTTSGCFDDTLTGTTDLFVTRIDF